jgi:hypothetical protein
MLPAPGLKTAPDEPPLWPCHALAPRLPDPGSSLTTVTERKPRTMAHYFEFVRRAARLRALLALAFVTVFGACDATDQLTEVSDEPTTSADPVTVIDASASRFRGGIPIGTSAQPTSAFGSDFNGSLRIIWPKYLRNELAAIRARGGRVVLMLAGNENHYKNRRGNFDLGKWKARVARFKSTNFSDFVRDGTIIGHYLVDEPYDPVNWHGKPIPGATLDEMGRFSKQLWPGMATIVRAEPYLMKWKGRYRYVDAAWAQYLWRKGDPKAYINRNVSEAKKMGLSLVVGLNLRHGGKPNMTWMTGSEIKSFGSALLSSNYPCAFISWYYDPRFLKTRDVKSAMASLRNQAQNRPQRSRRS